MTEGQLLREAGIGAVLRNPVQPVRTVGVIDHHLARVYKSPNDGPPQSEGAIRPYDPHGFHRHLIHRKETHYRGQRERLYRPRKGYGR